MERQLGAVKELGEPPEEGRVRRISLEPEHISDEVFVRICSSGKFAETEQLAGALKPLLDLFSSTNETKKYTTERGSIVREIISEVLACVDELRTLEQYVWLIKFSCSISLLKCLPPNISFETNKVIRCVASLDTEDYEFDPLMIHTVVRHLFEDIPLRGMNLVYVIRKLAVLNQRFFYYVAIALIFAGIHHCIQPEQPVEMYRLRNFSDMLAQMELLKAVCCEKGDLQLLFFILKLLSCYQNAAIVRHSSQTKKDIHSQHLCYGEFFQFPLEQRKNYLKWLYASRTLVRSMGSKQNERTIAEKEDFLLVTDLIEIEMIPLIEDDLGDAVYQL